MTQNVNKAQLADYEVGYKKPPRHTQFKKGQSGNKRGLRKPLTPGEAMLEILQQPLTVTVNGRRRRLTMQHALAMSLAQNGIKGNHSAAKTAFDLVKNMPVPISGPTKEEYEAIQEEAIRGLTPSELDALCKYSLLLVEATKRHAK